MAENGLRPGEADLLAAIEEALRSPLFESPDMRVLLNNVQVAAEEAERCGRRSLVPLSDALAVTLGKALAHRGTFEGITYLRELVEMVQPDGNEARG